MNELQKATACAIVNVFETGRVRGDYAAIAVLKGDKGHLSYGRSQAALGSGSLFTLLTLYCQQPGARFAAQISGLLPRMQPPVDITLDQDVTAHALLRQAAREDPVMRQTQDQFFDQSYLVPALRAAESFGVTIPLVQTLVYDSHIQGGWATLKDRIGPVGQRREEDWAQSYIALRRGWLLSLNPPLPNTVYRMDSFSALVTQAKWTLALPVAVHGVTITADQLTPDTPAPGDAPRILRLTTPYLRGDDVKALQRALTAKGKSVSDDGVYGPFTDALVKAWQASQTIVEDGVGPKTRASLGL